MTRRLPHFMPRRPAAAALSALALASFGLVSCLMLAMPATTMAADVTSATSATNAATAPAAVATDSSATSATSATATTSTTPAITSTPPVPAVPAAPLPRALTPVTAAPAAPAAVDAGSSPTGGLLTMVVGLGIVLAIMFGIAWLLKRSGVTRLQGNAAARVIGGVAVGTRERVVVVEVAGQWIVIGVAPGRVNHLATLPRADSDDALIDTPLAASNFSAWLKQTLEKRNASR